MPRGEGRVKPAAITIDRGTFDSALGTHYSALRPTWNRAIDGGGVVLGDDVHVTIFLEAMRKG